MKQRNFFVPPPRPMVPAKNILGASLNFHEVCGSNIQFLKNRSIASRASSFCNAIVFTGRPININEKIYLKVVQVSKEWTGGLRLGFTTKDPKSLKENLPRYVCPDLSMRPGFWAKSLSGVDEQLEIGTILHFFVDKNGACHYGVNGIEKGSLFGDVDTKNGPLWAIVDIYGRATGIELVHLGAPLLKVVKEVEEVKVNRRLTNYTLEKGLGVGGFGAVIMAVNGRTKEKCAIKIVSAIFEDEVHKELEALHMLRHENVVNCRASWKENLDSKTLTRLKFLLPQLPDTIRIPYGRNALDVMCMEMELCQSDLRNYLRKTPLSTIASQRISIFAGILCGLEYIHSQQVIHRDMKPENILLDLSSSSLGGLGQSVRVKIADVGLAKFASGGAGAGANIGVSLMENTRGLGTPYYLAPEQRSSQQYGRSADIYPLGIVLFELFYAQLNQGASQPSKQWNCWLRFVIDLVDLRRLPSDLKSNSVTSRLILSMTSEKPNSRPSAADILRQIPSIGG